MLTSRLLRIFLIFTTFLCITLIYHIINKKKINSNFLPIFNGFETSYDTVISQNNVKNLPLKTKIIKVIENKDDIKKFDDLINIYCPVGDNKAGYPCLEKLRQFKIEPDNFESELPIVLYHTFWKVEETKPYHLRVLILQILSFLATQDLTKSNFIIWVQHQFSPNIKKTLNDKFEFYLKTETIQVRVLDFKDLCDNGLFKKRFDNCMSTVNGNSVAFSDFIRFLVLYKYGGIYTDGDVFYLRDMRPFWKKNFVHRWSFTHDYNTAIMGLQLNRSPAIDAIYGAILNNAAMHIDLIGAFYPARVKDTIHGLNKGGIYNYTDFEVYHSIIFDPAWLCNDGVLPRLDDKIVCVFKEFYDTKITAEEFDIDKFYGGAFSFHLHLGNCGSCQIGPQSFFYHIENYFSKKIDKLGIV
jgi:hypothetical protein